MSGEGERVRERRSGLDGDLYVDREGELYTTCPVAAEDDPWWGATILSEGLVVELRDRGLLPLREVVHPEWADRAEKPPLLERLWKRMAI